MGLTAPAEFSTRATSVPLAVRMTPASAKVVSPAAAVAVSHVVPLSSDSFTTSPTPRGPFRVPEMVWLAMLVTKSMGLDPVSADKATVVTCASRRIVTSCWVGPASERSN